MVGVEVGVGLQKRTVVLAQSRIGNAMSHAAIPVVIIGCHHHVLEHVHDMIRRRKMFNKAWSLLHFDAHTNMACTRVAPARACFTLRHFRSINDISGGDDKNLYDLIDSTSSGIGEWITPLVLATNIGCIEWMKPKLSRQLPLGIHRVLVGAESDYPDQVTTFWTCR